MKKSYVLFVIVVLCLMLAACGAPSQASSDNPNTEQSTLNDAPVLPADYYIENGNGVVIYKVVTFTNRFGQNCTAMVSMYTDAAPDMDCDKPSQ